MNINDDYYVLKTNYKDEQYLKAAMLPNAVAEYQPVDYGVIDSSQPLEFMNNAADEFRERRLSEKVRDIVPANLSLIVKNRVKKILDQCEVANLQFYPAIYRDISGNIHEFWYLNFYKDFDCWCRIDSIYDRSEYEAEKEDEDFLGADIKKYALDQKILDLANPNEKMFFRMGNSCTNDLVIHKDILRRIATFDLYDLQYFKLSDYVRGMEF